MTPATALLLTGLTQGQKSQGNATPLGSSSPGNGQQTLFAAQLVAANSANGTSQATPTATGATTVGQGGAGQASTIAGTKTVSVTPLVGTPTDNQQLVAEEGSTHVGQTPADKAPEGQPQETKADAGALALALVAASPTQQTTETRNVSIVSPATGQAAGGKTNNTTDSDSINNVLAASSKSGTAHTHPNAATNTTPSQLAQSTSPIALSVAAAPQASAGLGAANAANKQASGSAATDSLQSPNGAHLGGTSQTARGTEQSQVSKEPNLVTANPQTKPLEAPSTIQPAVTDSGADAVQQSVAALNTNERGVRDVKGNLTTQTSLQPGSAEIVANTNKPGMAIDQQTQPNDNTATPLKTGVTPTPLSQTNAAVNVNGPTGEDVPSQAPIAMVPTDQGAAKLRKAAAEQTSTPSATVEVDIDGLALSVEPENVRPEIAKANFTAANTVSGKTGQNGPSIGSANTAQTQTGTPAVTTTGAEAAQVATSRSDASLLPPDQVDGLELARPVQDSRGGQVLAASRMPAETAKIDSAGQATSDSIAATDTIRPSNINASLAVRPHMQAVHTVPVQHLAAQIARHVQQGAARFEIRMDPPELGRVDVRMEFTKDGRVNAHLTVERPETLDLMQRDARALERALNNAGVNVDNSSLEFSLKDQNQGQTQGDKLGDNLTDNNDGSSSGQENHAQTERNEHKSGEQQQSQMVYGLKVAETLSYDVSA